VELVFLATRLRIPMVEVPVHWEEIDGSKIDIVSDSLKMARDILAIRTAYTIGAWRDRAAQPAAAAAAAQPEEAPKSAKSSSSKRRAA
jgi:dolichyl-phosphate beta-glucosyltransferase